MNLAAQKARFDASFLGAAVTELIRLEVVERSLALASKLFVAVIPLSIIISATVPGADNFGDSLVNRFGLTGAGADATRTLFATDGQIQGAVSVLGLVILFYSVFSFAKGLQRIYLDIWRLPAQQFDAILRRATWVLSFVLFTALLSPLRAFTDHNDLPISGLTISFVFGATLWVWTPYLLLGRRLPWQRLLPTGLLTAGAVAAYSLGCQIFLPEIFTTNAERYGLIGIAFGIVSFLFGYAAVVVGTAIVAGTWARYRAQSAQEPRAART
jgi:membrane protein